MFKPVLVCLQDKQKKDARAKKAVEKKEHELLQLVEQKNIDLVTFKEEMKTQYTVSPAKIEQIPSKVSYGVDKKEAHILIEKVKDILVQRVPHVD